MDHRVSNVTGVVLAGGQSSRMGSDKARLLYQGQSLLERTVELLAGTFDEVIMIADRVDRYDDLAACRVIADEIPGVGPLGGIVTALSEAHSSAVFVVGCDMPGLNTAVICEQLRVWTEDSGSDALVPKIDGRAQPLHAIYAKACRPAALELIRSGQRRVGALLDLIATRFWTPERAPAEAFANVNTPLEWAELVRQEGNQ
jgi:molybdopterin-guanine dinucleotide biosynthesis protein A